MDMYIVQKIGHIIKGREWAEEDGGGGGGGGGGEWRIQSNQKILYYMLYK